MPSGGGNDVGGIGAAAVRKAARIDNNQPAIVEALRQIGCTVHPTHMIGSGFPDIIAGYRGVNFLIEIKDGDKPPSKRRLTDDEERFHEDWRGQVATVEDVQGAIDLVVEATI